MQQKQRKLRNMLHFRSYEGALLNEALEKDDVRRFKNCVVKELFGKNTETSQQQKQQALKQDKETMKLFLQPALTSNAFKILQYLMDTLKVDPNTRTSNKTLLQVLFKETRSVPGHRDPFAMGKYLIQHERMNLQLENPQFLFMLLHHIEELVGKDGTLYSSRFDDSGRLKGMTFTHYQVKKYIEIMELFLKKIVKVDNYNYDINDLNDFNYINRKIQGVTLLWLAAHYGLSDVVELLLRYGADFTITGSLRQQGGVQAVEETTPLQETLRLKKGDWERCQQLLSYTQKVFLLDRERHFTNARKVYDMYEAMGRKEQARTQLRKPEYGSVINARAARQTLLPTSTTTTGNGQSRKEEQVMRLFGQLREPHHATEIKEMLRPPPKSSTPWNVTQRVQKHLKKLVPLVSTPQLTPYTLSTLSDTQKGILQQARRIHSSTQKKPLQQVVQAYTTTLQKDYGQWKKLDPIR